MLEVDVQRLIEAASKEGHSDEGLTTEEWAAELGVPTRVARGIIISGLERKILRRGKRRDDDHWSGRPTWYTVYGVVSEG